MTCVGSASIQTAPCSSTAGREGSRSAIVRPAVACTAQIEQEVCDGLPSIPDPERVPWQTNRRPHGAVEPVELELRLDPSRQPMLLVPSWHLYSGVAKKERICSALLQRMVLRRVLAGDCSIGEEKRASGRRNDNHVPGLGGSLKDVLNVEHRVRLDALPIVGDVVPDSKDLADDDEVRSGGESFQIAVDHILGRETLLELPSRMPGLGVLRSLGGSRRLRRRLTRPEEQEERGHQSERLESPLHVPLRQSEGNLRPSP